VAERHGIRPTKALGQHFLADPNLARRIAELAGVGPKDAVLEIGAGLGSLTVALAATGARVLAVERDRALLPALRDVLAGAGADGVDVVVADAMRMDWPSALAGADRWAMASNLPYNVATPLVLELLAAAPAIDTLLVMVQREVGERLAALPGREGYGAVSVKVALRADAEIVRRVPASVFWPAPKVASVLVRLRRLPRMRVATDPAVLFRVVDEGFAQRRKMMRSALRRLGLGPAEAERALARAGIPPRARAEEIGLEGFARLAQVVEHRGDVRSG
jgi:16S rRNA (adenine1518-N6/adenine1519-N6)-dimethyltransferase